MFYKSNLNFLYQGRQPFFGNQLPSNDDMKIFFYYFKCFDLNVSCIVFPNLFKKMPNRDVDDVLEMIGESLVTDKASR